MSDYFKDNIQQNYKEVEKINKQRKQIQQSTDEINKIFEEFDKQQAELSKKYGW